MVESSAWRDFWSSHLEMQAVSSLLAVSPNIHFMSCLLCPLIFKCFLPVYFSPPHLQAFFWFRTFSFTISVPIPKHIHTYLPTAWKFFLSNVIPCKAKNSYHPRNGVENEPNTRKTTVWLNKEGALLWYFWFPYQYIFFFHSQLLFQEQQT